MIISTKKLSYGIVITAVLIISTSHYSFAENINRIVAVVNDDIITEYDLQKAMNPQNKAQKQKNIGKEIKTAIERSKVLNQMINKTILDQLIADAKLKVSDDNLAHAIAGVLHNNHMTLDQLKSELTSKGMTYSEYKKTMRKQIKRIKFINQVIGPKVKITDQDLRDYYQHNQEQFRSSHQAHIAEIVLPLNNIKTQAEFDKVKNLSLSISTKARHEKSFKKLAKRYSKGINADGGGDMGMITLKSLPAPVAEAIRSMEIGSVSLPIFTGKAIAVIKLISLPEISAKDFSRLRDDIYSALYDKRIEQTLKAYIAKERLKAFINIR